jgi:hypothetical protein
MNRFLVTITIVAIWSLSAMAQDDQALLESGGRFEQDGVVANVTVTGNDKDGHAALVAVSFEDYVVAVKAYTGIDSPLMRPQVSFVEIDGANTETEVFVSRWTGGAHCCAEITVFSQPDAGDWKTVEVGTFDGDPERYEPQDINGDGQLEIVAYDNAFLYQYSSYAGSYAPLKLLAVRDGAVVDVTRESQFRDAVQSDLDNLGDMPDMSSDRNAWLAAEAALLILLGDPAPFAKADILYDKTSDIGLLECTDGADPYDCPQDKVRRLEFPDALRQFLAANGYEANR